jgi:hypothetical protein
MTWTIVDQGLSTVDVVDQNGLLVAEVSNTCIEDLAAQSLIAAAPELLAALRRILGSYPGSMLDPEIKWQGYAAIALATAPKSFQPE